jgi:hypothetical protein
MSRRKNAHGSTDIESLESLNVLFKSKPCLINTFIPFSQQARGLMLKIKSSRIFGMATQLALGLVLSTRTEDRCVGKVKAA